MKKIAAFALVLACLLLTGCAGTTVIYQSGDLQNAEQPSPETPSGVKTGLAIVTDISGSQSAVAASFDVTVVAVTVDDGGVIRGCLIDGAAAQMTIDGSGAITGDTTAPVTTRQEENGVWLRRAEVLMRSAVGKTVGQLRAAGEWDASLFAAVEKAALSARPLGASAQDELRLAIIPDLSGSETGRARLACDAAAVTLSGDTVTSCYIDSVQADVGFDVTGTITNDLSAAVRTKRELGDDYGMKAYGGAKYEWYEQADHFAAYVTGMTGPQVLEIPTAEGKAADADLYASVTITVTPFQRLVAKACGVA